MRHNVEKYILGNAVKSSRTSRLLSAVLLGLAIGFGSHYVADNYYYQPRVPQLQQDRRAQDIFDKISSTVYPVNFYKSSPHDALSRLIETKRIIENNRAFLNEGGYAGNITWKIEGVGHSGYTGLSEEKLDLAIEKVQVFLTNWPQNEKEWFDYLYDGKTKRPPQIIYSAEIEEFFNSSHKAASQLGYNFFRSRFIRDYIPATIGILYSSLLWFVYPHINLFLRNRYRTVLTREKLEENLEKLTRV